MTGSFILILGLVFIVAFLIPLFRGKGKGGNDSSAAISAYIQWSGDSGIHKLSTLWALLSSLAFLAIMLSPSLAFTGIEIPIVSDLVDFSDVDSEREAMKAIEGFGSLIFGLIAIKTAVDALFHVAMLFSFSSWISNSGMNLKESLGVTNMGAFGFMKKGVAISAGGAAGAVEVLRFLVSVGKAALIYLFGTAFVEGIGRVVFGYSARRASDMFMDAGIVPLFAVLIGGGIVNFILNRVVFAMYKNS